MRHTVLAVIILTAVVGCARISTAPTLPSSAQPGLSQAQQSDEPYRLWAEATIFINSAHDSVEIVPRREGRFHLNALKFLESYCTDCLKIEKIKNNGDGTVDLTVKITHPFKGYPEYTGFDVKGIIMFNGSHELWVDYHGDWLQEVPLPHPTTRISWRELGDPQVLNADGYARRWAISYDSGSDLPIFNYWKGKYASGEPTADVNAFLNFYTVEDRHMFEVNASVSRTYKLWLPAGQPVVAGYAVEACWEPPTVTPVINPLTDFPTSANQAEAYYLNWVLNNGEPIKYDSGCCNGNGDCSDNRLEIKQWGGITTDTYLMIQETSGGSNAFHQCEPQEDGVLSPDGFWSSNWVPGKHQILFALSKTVPVDDYCYATVSFTIIEFEVIE